MLWSDQPKQGCGQVLHGYKRNGLAQGLNLPADDVGLDGLLDRAPANVGDVGDLRGPFEVGEIGEVGDAGGIGAFLGDSYDVLMNGGVACSTVRIEALSSSSIPDKVVRSEEYGFSIELTRVKDVVDDRIVSVSLPELIVDIVRSDAILEALSEPDVDEGAIPMSCLCAPQ